MLVSKFRILVTYRYPRQLVPASRCYARNATVMSEVNEDENVHPGSSRSRLFEHVQRDKRSRGEQNTKTASPRKRRHITYEGKLDGNETYEQETEKTSYSPIKTALGERTKTSAYVIENASGLNNAPCFVRTSVSLSQLFSGAGGQIQHLHNRSFTGYHGKVCHGQYSETSYAQQRQHSTYSIPHSVYHSVHHQPTPAQSDVGHGSQEVTANEENRGYQDPDITDRQTLPREWEYTESGAEHEQRPLSGLEFSVMSYNVLAQKLLEDHRYLYDDSQAEALQWQYRREVLLEEIATHNADVMCLQEVQENHFQDFFQPQLEYLGYRGIYQKRTGDKCDGCATFYKLEKFSLGNTVPVEYCRGGLLDRDNIALIVELIPRADMYYGTVDKICVANTHLLFNPRRGDIKLGQLMILMAELDKCAHNHSPGTSAVDYSPVILCGDFNCEPHSDLYKFVARGYLNYKGLKARVLSGQREGLYGRDYYLRKDFFCKTFGITDQCQYQHLLHERLRRVFTPSPTPSPSTVEEDSTSPTGKDNSKTEHDVHQDPSKGSKLVESDVGQGPSKNISFVPQNVHREQSISPHMSPMGTSYGFLTSPADFSQSTMGSGQLWHRLNLVSSYKHTIARLNHEIEEVTTHHNGGSCSVDFIFYNVLHKEVKTRAKKIHTRNIREGKLTLLKRYGLMSQQEIYKLGDLPNPLCPSDHVPLISTFILQD